MGLSPTVPSHAFECVVSGSDTVTSSTVNLGERSRSAKNGFRKTILICTRGYTLQVRHFHGPNSFLESPDQIFPEVLSANLSALSVDAQKRAEKDAAKKAAKAAAAEQREAERKAEAMVLIKRVERNKRKYVTVVSGLEEHGLDLKKVAKELGKKFATGSSVTKTAAGGEEITVQGDVSDDLYDWLVEQYPDIPEDNLDMKDEVKKKG